MYIHRYDNGKGHMYNSYRATYTTVGETTEAVDCVVVICEVVQLLVRMVEELCHVKKPRHTLI